jgi:hypothetical protein
MASDPPTTSVDASLNGLDNAMDAYNNLQTGRQRAGALRKMFNVFSTGAEAAEAVVAGPKPSQHPGPN